VFDPQPCGGPQCCKDFNSESSPTYPKCDKVSANSTTETSCKCAITARPCCFGLVGRCEIQSLEWCDYQGGTWHDKAVTCDQVTCLEDSCGLVQFANDDVVRLLIGSAFPHTTVCGWRANISQVDCIAARFYMHRPRTQLQVKCVEASLI